MKARESMKSMRSSGFAVLGLVILTSSLAFGQSLGELAAKEKERRQKNKQSGKPVRVVTDSELRQPEETGSSAESSETTPNTAPRPSGASSSSEEVEQGSGRATDLPREGSLESRIQVFQSLKKGYEQEVAKIDLDIAKNRQRLVEIEEKLASLGAGGLPVAPQPDMAPRYDGEFFGLMDEKGKLQTQNQELEARKESLWQELAEKARRAGIPPGYLRK